MGIHTANPISGDFSLGVNGFLIEGGKKTSPVKGMALAGNIVSLFKNITAVGSDLRFYGKIGSPSLMIDAMDISGS
jgi:PmbA protein